MRKYHFDENYFENIDTEKKAYWLGFIASDGSLNYGSKETASLRIHISVHERDETHLAQFRKDINGDFKIKRFLTTSFEALGYSPSSMVRVDVNSNKLCKDLMKQGICFNKTYHLKIPNLDNEFIRHYLRGYFDGDGHVGFVKRKGIESHRKDRFNFEIVSKTVEILEYFQYNLRQNDINANIYQRKSNGMFRLVTASRKEGLKLFHYIYKNSNTYMQRKYDVFCKIAV